MSTSAEQIKTLNTLITVLYDGKNGYTEAAEEVKNETLAIRFRELAEQRHYFITALTPIVRNLGGEANESGSIAASIHRVWIDLKTAVAGNDTKAIIAECTRGEEAAVAAYETALEDTTLDEFTRELAVKHLEDISSVLADLRKTAASGLLK